MREAAGLTDAEIVRLMVGRDLSDVFQRRPAGTDREVLRVDDLHSNWHRDVSFYINAGEVVGFAGLVGAGRTRAGQGHLRRAAQDRGRVIVDGKELDLHPPGDAIAKGIGFAPEDRKREGLVLIRSVLENASLAILRRLSRFHFVRGAPSGASARTSSKGCACGRPRSNRRSASSPAATSRRSCWRAGWRRKPKVLILDEPTRGIDVGAKAEIYRLIDDLANEGLGIMFISSELPEILGLSDRIYVMQNGRITGELPGPRTTEAVLELAMADHLAAGRAQRPRPEGKSDERDAAVAPTPTRPRATRHAAAHALQPTRTSELNASSARRRRQPFARPRAHRHRGHRHLSAAAVLLLAEPHEQPGPGDRDRRAAGPRRDRGDRRRRARHLGRLHRLGGLGGGVGLVRLRGRRATSRCPIPIVQGSCWRGHRGHRHGHALGVINGLIVTELRVNPIIATLGTLAAFAGFAFLLAPEGKPVGVVTQPDFTWLAKGRF